MFLGFCPEANKSQVRNHIRGSLRPGLILHNAVKHTRFGLDLSCSSGTFPDSSNLRAETDFVCECHLAPCQAHHRCFLNF